MSYLLLVLGDVGVGKSSLIHCVQHTVTSHQDACSISSTAKEPINEAITPSKTKYHDTLGFSGGESVSPTSPIMPRVRGMDAQHALQQRKDKEYRFTMVILPLL